MEYYKNFDLANIVYFCELDLIWKQEQWMWVSDYIGIYKISDLGRLKSLGNNKDRKEKILKQTNDNRGYLIVGLSKQGTAKMFKIHQLVAIAFLDHVPCGHDKVVDHIWQNKYDNRATSLRIITQRENSNRKHLKSSSQFTGVSYIKATNKWKSAIVSNGKVKHLGAFRNELDAAITYECALLGLTHEKDFFFINID